MLNPFPIQFLSLFAYFILRVIVGLVFLLFSYRHFKYRAFLYIPLSLKIFPFGKITTAAIILAELIIGILFTLGIYTQIAALLCIALSIKMIFLVKKFSSPYLPTRLTYLLLFGIGCSLFITGAGVFAFDLPI